MDLLTSGISYFAIQKLIQETAKTLQEIAKTFEALINLYEKNNRQRDKKKIEEFEKLAYNLFTTADEIISCLKNNCKEEKLKELINFQKKTINKLKEILQSDVILLSNGAKNSSDFTKAISIKFKLLDSLYKFKKENFNNSETFKEIVDNLIEEVAYELIEDLKANLEDISQKYEILEKNLEKKKDF